MQHTTIVRSLLTGTMASLVFLTGTFAVQASTTPVDPSTKLQNAVTAIETKFNTAYTGLTAEQQDTVVATRFKNTTNFLKNAKKAVLSASTALSNLAYGDATVKSEVQLQLSSMYAQLSSYQTQVRTYQKQYDSHTITTDQANADLTSVTNEAIAYLQSNSTTYAKILAEVLENQDSNGLAIVSANLNTLNTVLASYTANGTSVSKISSLAGKAATNYSTANDLYVAGIKETDLAKQIYDLNACGRYLVKAEAQIVAAERAINGLER